MACDRSIGSALVVVLMLLATTQASFLSHLGHEINKHKNDIKFDQLLDINKLFDWAGKEIYNFNVLDMSWSNCGSASDIVQIKSLSVGPDPLRIPGTMQASFDVKVSQNITQPVSTKLRIEVKKNPFGWVKVPCVDHQGSCEYDDACPQTPAQSCKEVFDKYNIPCSCPVSAGEYKLPEIDIPMHPHIPAFFKHGEYKLKVEASNPSGRLACLDMHFKLN